MNKLASLEATLLEITTESLTRVKCRATTVAKKQAGKPRSYASSKLCPPTDGVKCRATSIDKNLTHKSCGLLIYQTKPRRVWPDATKYSAVEEQQGSQGEEEGDN